MFRNTGIQEMIGEGDNRTGAVRTFLQQYPDPRTGSQNNDLSSQHLARVKYDKSGYYLGLTHRPG